jgi:signal peptidase I
MLAGLVIAGLAPYAIGWRPSVITSGSMMPAIAAGDVVVAAPGAPAAIRPRDVIVFTDPANQGNTVAHRVVASRPDGSLTTRGDANQVADSTPVPATAVLGRVRLRIPYVGLPKYWLATRQWTPLAVLCALLAALVLGADPGPLARRARRRTADPGPGSGPGGGAGATG